MNTPRASKRAGRVFRRLAVIGIAAVLGLGVLVLLEPDPIQAELGTVDQGPVALHVREEGQTRIRDRYTVHAPRDGILVRPGVRVGDAVRGGATVLAVLEPREPAFVDIRRRGVLEAQVAAAHARIDAARAALGEAEARCNQAWRELHRAEQMSLAHITPDEEVERLHAAAAIAERARDARQAELEASRHLAQAVELELGDGYGIENGPEPPVHSGRNLAVLAPVDGRVLRVFEESGRPVLAGQPLFEIGNPSEIEVRASFLSHDALRLGPDLFARVGTTPGFGHDVVLPLEARIHAIEPRARTVVSALGVEEQRVDVVLEPIGTWPLLGDGFHVEVSIEVEHSPPDAIRTPAPSLFRHGEGWAVHRIDGDGRSWITAVEVGLISADHAEVLGGLSPGDRVVLYPSRWIEDGSRVVTPSGR
jgi:HlyD family secretion protein